MVCLPTGLGKTFIAAVVMHNFFRWFPRGKVLFMAPTRPLVAQQIRACYKLADWRQADMCEMTGKAEAADRSELWRTKRVFFATPQCVEHDIKRGMAELARCPVVLKERLLGTCPAHEIVCLVIDEAHRAQKNFSYCIVVREIAAVNPRFRVLALTATPGCACAVLRSIVMTVHSGCDEDPAGDCELPCE